ncbi:MAG: ABC-2 family transporter protein [Treponema sp.]|nr:ABC-2 family transporter protein [Treponema sp.]
MIYFNYLAMHLKAALQYRFSVWLTALGQFFVAFFGFISIWLLFERFGSIADWTFAEVGLCFGVTNIAFSLSECFARGFDSFSGMVIRGDFDRLLLRPRSTLIQVLGAGIEFTRIGKLVQGFIVLALLIPWSGIVWTPGKIVTLTGMIAGGAAVFTGVFILGATVCFFTLEGLEVINILTDGGREFASYPLPVYGKWVRRFFTFLIPYGCMNYLPLMYLTGRAERFPLLYMLSPLLGFFFIVPCVLVWRRGVRHYASTGS